MNAAGKGEVARECEDVWVYGLGDTARESEDCCAYGFGDTARECGLGGAGETARKAERLLLCRDGTRGDFGKLSSDLLRGDLGKLSFDALSFDVRFIVEYGLWLFRLPVGVLSVLPPLCKLSRRAASGFGLPAAAYAWNGFLKTLFDFAGSGFGLAARDMLPPPLERPGIGLVGR